MSLSDLSLDEFLSFSPLIQEDVYEAISLLTCVNNRTLIGGPAPDTVLAALNEAKQFT